MAYPAHIFPNVHLADNVVLQEGVIIGQPPSGMAPGELPTFIGSDAIIRSHSVIYAGSRIGSKFQTGHRAILGPGLEIGYGCSVGTNSVVIGYAHLADHARIHGLCTVGAFAVLQANAWVGPYCLLDSSINQPITIASRAILGLKVYVAPGVYVGERTLVSTRSVLHADVPPYRLIMGNPPRVLQSLDQLKSPYEMVGRPYKADPPEVQKTVLEHYQSRAEDAIANNTWRHHLWSRLTRPEALKGS